MRNNVATIFIALVLGLIMAVPAGAADAGISMRAPTGVYVRELPYPRSVRAEAVWNERACWSECGSYCAWGMAGCLARDSQGRCLKLTDRCDRHCQRACRTAGGPFLPDIFD